MNKEKCQCHKQPCICKNGPCNKTRPTDETVENTDENEQSHIVESIFKKISLKDFDNVEACCQSKVPAEDQPNIVQSNIVQSNIVQSNIVQSNIVEPNLPSIIEEEKEKETKGCLDCCDHMYTTVLHEEKHDCKDHCNITAELYCKIKKKNAEPGETFSECSTSSSSSVDTSNESEIIGDHSTDYVSAQGGKTEDNSEILFGNEDEDSFNLIEETENRIPCQKEDCCITDPVHICKNKTDMSKHTIGDSKKQIILKKLQKPNENEERTTQPSSPNKKDEHERTNEFYSIPQSVEQSKLNETKLKTIEPENNKKEVNAVDSLSESLPPDHKDKFSGQSWKRQKLQIVEQSDTDNQSERSKSQKRVLIDSNVDESKNNLEVQCIVKNRKRKFGSEETIFTEPQTDEPQAFERNPEFQLDSDIYLDTQKDNRKSFGGRKKRITIFNFVPEDKLRASVSDLDLISKGTQLSVPQSVLDRTDSYLLLSNKTDDVKRQWDTIVPRDRSDIQVLPKDSFIKKLEKTSKKKRKAEIKPEETIRRKEPRLSYFRQKVTHYKPSKFLCFKYIPKVTTQGSSSSLLGDDLMNQIYIDPPDFSQPTTDTPRFKYQGSRIPVSQFKGKTEEKIELSSKTSSEDIDPSDLHPRRRRRTTIGVDELRNVVERKSNVVRRTLIPPELRKTLLKRGTISKKSVFQANLDENASTSFQSSSKQRVTYFDQNEGSDTSLRNKLGKQDQANKSKLSDKESSTKKIKQNQFLFSEKPSYKSLNDNNLLQKTCCSQTRIHVCIKESGVKIKESENILQTVKIDVTPKHSNIVKICVMPTVPEINKDGIITIPVQIQLSTSAAKLEPKEKLLYQENPEYNWYEHYMEELFKDEKDFSSQNIPADSYANLLWNKLKVVISESDREKSKVSDYDNIEIQTDLTLGPKLLSKSLSSISSNDSSTQNKSEPVKKTGIDWDNILLPPPGSVAIKKVPRKKSKQRFTGDYAIQKDISIPSTSEGLPPTEEIGAKDVKSVTNYLKTKFKGCCCPVRESKDEPYRPASNKTPSEVVTGEEIPTENKRSKIISLVFSESYYQNENYMNPLHKTQLEDGKNMKPCTSKPELPWTNILLPYKPQIRKIEKPDVSKTSTSITDQLETSTDEYNSSPSPKTTDTYPNLTEDSSHNCDCGRMYNDKATNTTMVEDVEALPCTRATCPSNTNYICSNSLQILKTYKEDPVLLAFKAFEEELKPVRRALAEVQSKLRALNIPELEYIFRKDPISEFLDMSRSNSQIGGDYRQPSTPYACKWSSDTRRPSTCTGRPTSYDRNAEFLNHPRRHPCDLRVYRFATPPISVRSRTLSNDIWRTFGSCERNSVRGPNEKFWVPPNLYKMHTADSYNCLPCQSRNPTPEYVTFDSSGVNRYCLDTGPYFPNIFERRVEMLNEDDNLDYPSSYENIQTSPNNYPQPQPEYYCNEFEHNLRSNEAERLNTNHICPSCHQVPTSDNYNNRYIPVKVRPVTHYYIPTTEGPSVHNPNAKKGIVYARTKIELPKLVYKHSNNVQKNVRKIYPQPKKHYCSHCRSEYFGFNRQPNDSAYEYPSDDYNLPNFPSCYKECSRNERYT